VATTGKTYLCTITFSSVSNYYARVFFEGGYGYSPGINAQGTYTSIMSPGQANSKLFIQNISGLFVGSIDQISLREILNYNYAIAPSDAARPNLRLDGNGKFYLDRDTTDDDLPITWPTNLTTTGVIYTATGDYTTKDSGLTLSGLTSYKFPQRPSGDYGRIVMAAESKYDAKIIKYLDAKRGRSYQLGPELVSNYNFATGDLTGWTVAGNNATNTVAYEGGACRFIADGSSILTLSPTVGTIAVGKAYLIIANQLSATGQGIRLNTASPGVLTYIPIAVGVYSFAIVATGTNVVLQRTAAGSASNVLLKSLSVREIIL
jgi:hypothetical protein